MLAERVGARDLQTIRRKVLRNNCMEMKLRLIVRFICGFISESNPVYSYHGPPMRPDRHGPCRAEADRRGP